MRLGFISRELGSRWWMRCAYPLDGTPQLSEPSSLFSLSLEEREKRAADHTHAGVNQILQINLAGISAFVLFDFPVWISRYFSERPPQLACLQHRWGRL